MSLYNKVYNIYLYVSNLYNINKVFNLKVYPKLKKTLFFNYFLNNKIKSLEIEYIINFFFKTKLNISLVDISNVFSFSKFNKIPKYSNIVLNSGKIYYKDTIRSFFFVMNLKNSSVMSFCIGRYITNYKTH